MIYLSSKITDENPEKQRANLDRLNEKAEELRKKGLEVFNPGELEEKDKSWTWYLARDLHWIMTNKPDVLFMKGWESSKGCQLEHELVTILKLKKSYE